MWPDEEPTSCYSRLYNILWEKGKKAKKAINTSVQYIINNNPGEKEKYVTEYINFVKYANVFEHTRDSERKSCQERKKDGERSPT